MNKETLIEASRKVSNSHALGRDEYYRAYCMCNFVTTSETNQGLYEEVANHVAEKQIEALIPLIGQGIAEAIGGIEFCYMPIMFDGIERSEALQVIQDWKP